MRLLRLQRLGAWHAPGLCPFRDSMLGGKGGRGLCGMAMGPVWGMLELCVKPTLCVLKCSVLPFPLIPIPIPLLWLACPLLTAALLVLPGKLFSVHACDMNGFCGGLYSSKPAEDIATARLHHHM